MTTHRLSPVEYATHINLRCEDVRVLVDEVWSSLAWPSPTCSGYDDSHSHCQSDYPIDTSLNEMAKQKSSSANLSLDSREKPQRQPHSFPNVYSEIGFCFTLCMTQFLAEYLISGFALQLPLISERTPSVADSGTSALWPASLLSLVMSATLLVFARLSDMFGGYWPFMSGLVWLTIWTLIPGLTDSAIVLNCARAMQGLALAAFMPSTFAILGRLYAPGRRKTVIIGIYSAFNCLGFFGGFIVAGALGIDHSEWYFLIGAMLSALTALTAWWTIPRAETSTRNRIVGMDCLGSGMIISGLLLLSYSLAAEPYADEQRDVDGFATAVVLGPLIAGLICLICALVVEWKFAKSPLVPLTFFKSWGVVSLSLACMCFYACFGVWLYYTVE
jgi:MFS family permease